MKKRKIRIRFTILLFFSAFLSFSKVCWSSSFSGTVLDKKTKSPIAGVRVSIGYSDTVTYTDVNGYFSFDKILGSRDQLSIKKTPESILIRQTSQHPVIDLTGCLSVNCFKVFDLRGRCLFKADISNSSRILQLPLMSRGIYVIQLLKDNQAKYGFKWNRMNLLQTGIFDGEYKKGFSAQVSTSSPIVLQNDFYYPARLDALSSRTIIYMEPDPRAEVFAGKKVARYDFVLTHDDSLSMEKNALKEEYIPADFSYNNIRFGRVGLRYKGSTYSLPNCFEKDGTRKDKPECHKISLKVKFDKYDESLRFYKMKRLNLHSESVDQSMMHDILSYSLFREMGIISPRCAFAQVFINGSFQGLYCAVEAIDGRFTDARWPEDGDGNLYKEKWPVSDKVSYYKNGLETNDNPEDSADVTRMIDFYKAINNSSHGTFKAMVSPFLDFDYWLHYIAADRVIHNCDGIMTWYNQPGWVSNHNYFFYQPIAPNSRLWLIPWDLHVTFARKDPIVDVLGMPEWNVTPPDCEPVPIWGEDQTGFPAHCDKLTGLTADVFWDDFVRISEKMLSTCFDIEHLQKKIDVYKSLVDSVVRRDPHVDYNTWLGQVNTLRNDIVSLNVDFDDYIHKRKVENDTAEYLKPFTGSGYLLPNKLNNFEFEPTGNIGKWSDYYSSKNTTITLTHDTLEPLWGKADLLYSFVYDTAPGEGRYLEWSRINIDFEKPADLSSLKEIQVNLKSDVNREMFMCITSPQYSEYDVSVEYGWFDGTLSRDSLRVFKIKTISYAPWASGNPPDILEKVLANASGIGIQSNPRFNSDGELLLSPDSGFLRIDNIRLVF